MVLNKRRKSAYMYYDYTYIKLVNSKNKTVSYIRPHISMVNYIEK